LGEALHGDVIDHGLLFGKGVTADERFGLRCASRNFSDEGPRRDHGGNFHPWPQALAGLW